MRTKDEAFEFVRDLILRLKNELTQAMRATAVTMAQNSKTFVLTPFAVIKGLNTSILLPTLHSRMEL